MSAIVVGPEGQTTANGADELWCDALVRIKIGFHWRLLAAPETSTWLSEKTWGEKGIKDALAEFMENKHFHEQTDSINQELVIGMFDRVRAGGLFRG